MWIKNYDSKSRYIVVQIIVGGEVSTHRCFVCFVQDVISLVATEYTRLFAHNSKLTKDEKKAKLLHHLSVSGIYHSFKVINSRFVETVWHSNKPETCLTVLVLSTPKEKLKPRISRVVRKKFGPKQQALEATTAAEAGESQLEFDEFLSKLYVHLLNESTSVRRTVARAPSDLQ